MGKTDELRRFLDERDISYIPDDGKCAKETIWKPADDVTASYVDFGGGTDATHFVITYWDLSPEQAVEMVDEREACHTVLMDCFGNPPYNKSGLNGNDVACGCSECGAPWSTMGVFRGNKLKHNFKACPLCGRKVIG